jgi:tol-pal system protein YbgF
MRGDNASLRGQNEELTRVVSELQRRQKDLQAGLDDRIRKMEPQKVSVDGKEFSADPEEKRQYDEAMDLLRKSDFAGTANALSAFRRRYPASGYNESALFWLGNAQYGVRQYKEAITSFRTLVAGSPDHPKAPEALLAIANCQAELKDSKGARATIGELLKNYPKSEAAQAGRDRLASLK